ncbi:MAG: hypothetical protein ACRDK4_05140 [Solirubrobacteraceae bacterium]
MASSSGQGNSGATTERGKSNLIEKVAAIKLILASRELSTNAPRALDMTVEWVLANEEPKPANSEQRPVRLFIAAIKVTKK